MTIAFLKPLHQKFKVPIEDGRFPRNVYVYVNNKEDYVNINETDFNFGFGIESKKEFMLGSGGEFKLSIDDKNEDLDKIEEENIDNIELDEVVDIDELELEDIDTENIQSEEVEINEVEKPKKGRKAKK